MKTAITASLAADLAVKARNGERIDRISGAVEGFWKRADAVGNLVG